MINGDIFIMCERKIMLRRQMFNLWLLSSMAFHMLN